MPRFKPGFLRRHRKSLPVSDQLLVSDVSVDGFRIERLVGSRVNTYRWAEMLDVEVDLKRRILYFRTHQERTFVVPAANHEGWYKLLKGVPKGFPGFDYVGRDVFFEKLTGCGVCGALAVEPPRCLACDTKAYIGPSGGAAEYYREKQLEYFAQRLGPGLGTLPLPPPDGFPPDPDFTLLVSDEEVYRHQQQFQSPLL